MRQAAFCSTGFRTYRSDAELGKRSAHYSHQYDERRKLWRSGILACGHQNRHDYNLYRARELTHVWSDSKPDAPYLHNFTAHGGFLPNGWFAIFSALLVVTFSYGGSELIGLTLTETEHADKIPPKVVRNFILRVILFFTLPILIICGLIPWNQLGGEASPFVQVLSATGLQGTAHIMNFILVTAVLSAANSGIYGATRMIYSMAAAGEAPKSLAKTTNKGIPLNTLKLCAIILLAGSLLDRSRKTSCFGF